MREAFHGVRDGDGGSGVKGMVENTIIVQTEQFHKLQRTIVDKGAERGRGEQGGHRNNNVRWGGRGRVVGGHKPSVSTGGNDDEGDTAGERVLPVSDANVVIGFVWGVTNIRCKWYSLDFDATNVRTQANRRKGCCIISGPTVLHQPVAIGWRRGLSWSLLYVSVRTVVGGPTPKRQPQRCGGRAR